MSQFDEINGTIDGVQFNSWVLCIARSPKWILIWDPGGKYWASRQENYGSSGLFLVKRGGYTNYQRLTKDGGKLSKAKIEACSEKIDRAFGSGTAQKLIDEHMGRGQRSTLLIDGGGKVPSKSHRAMKREHEAKNPPPKKILTEQLFLKEDELERLIRAAQTSLEHANDPEGQQVWEKLMRMRTKFQMKDKPLVPSDFTPPRNLRL